MMAGADRPRLRIAVWALGFTALKGAFLLGLALRFGPDWPTNRQDWADVGLICARVAVLDVACVLTLARPRRPSWFALALTAFLAFSALYWTIVLALSLFRDRLTLETWGGYVLRVEWLLSSAVLGVALLWSADPEQIPPPRTILARVALLVAGMGGGLGLIVLAARWGSAVAGGIADAARWLG